MKEHEHRYVVAAKNTGIYASIRLLWSQHRWIVLSDKFLLDRLLGQFCIYSFKYFFITDFVSWDVFTRSIVNCAQLHIAQLQPQSAPLRDPFTLLPATSRKTSIPRQLPCQAQGIQVSVPGWFVNVGRLQLVALLFGVFRYQCVVGFVTRVTIVAYRKDFHECKVTDT